MLTGNDKQPNPLTERFRGSHPKRTWFGWFEHLFLRFGAGAHHLEPITKSRYWNAFCWTVIALGIIGWMILFWVLRTFSESPF
jgi:hypothetical protein